MQSNVSLPPLGKLTDEWPARQAELVGRILIAFSQLEWVLYLFPKRLRGELLANYRNWPENFGVEDRCRQIEAESAAVLHGELLERVTAIVGRIRMANHGADERLGRNDIVHGPWVSTLDGSKLLLRDNRGRPIEDEGLLDLLAEVRSLRDELNSIECPSLSAAQKAKLKPKPTPNTYRTKR